MQQAQTTFREKHIWLLLPLLFAIHFLPDSQTGARNFYAVLIFLPVAFSFRFEDWPDIRRYAAARWFLLLVAWMLLTLVWDGIEFNDKNYLVRALVTMSLFYLVYLVNRYHPERQATILKSFLVFGLAGAVLILIDWRGMENVGAARQHFASARGVFDHHVFVGWAMAVTALVALWLTLHEARYKVPYGLAFVFLLVVTFLVQSRGGYVVFATGAGLIVLTHWRKSWLWPVLFGLAAVLVLGLAFQTEVRIILEKVVERGTSGRIPIWSNGWEAATGSALRFLFGHGLSADSTNMMGSYQADHYHNLYLNILYHAGLVGLALYVMTVVAALRRAIRTRALFFWGIVLAAMQVGFIPDGEHPLQNPSATMLCLLLPLFYATFGKTSKEPEPAVTGHRSAGYNSRSPEAVPRTS